MALAIIFLCIALFIGLGAVIFSYFLNEKYSESHVNTYQYGWLFGTMLMFFVMLGLYSLEHHYSPRAIDVYRNKTELKIRNTIENDKIVDSDTIVVFKK
jgi:TRAP-type C4-dicarboxylate transport system permease small subunit